MVVSFASLGLVDPGRKHVFGRLSQEKRDMVVVMMVDKINRSVRQLIFYTSEEQYNTPKKPYVDELYILCFAFFSTHYVKWRRERQDAYEDTNLVFSFMCDEAIKHFKGDFPFQANPETADDLREAIGGEVLGKRVLDYLFAFQQLTSNIDTGRKWVGENMPGLSGGAGEAMAGAMATKLVGNPFLDLVTERVFD